MTKGRDVGELVRSDCLYLGRRCAYNRKTRKFSRYRPVPHQILAPNLFISANVQSLDPCSFYQQTVLIMASSKHIAQVLLDQAYPPEAAAAIFTEKVLRKPLHLRPTSPDPSSQDARARRRLQRLRKEEKTRRRQKTKPLSAKEKRISGIYDIPDNQKKYEIYVPLHRMWLGYMWEILGMREGEKAYVTAQGAGSKLASADYHGAEVIIVRGRCVGMVGLTGIVVRDTKFTFQIITKKNELKSKELWPL